MPCRPVNTLSRRAHPESVPTNKRRQRHLQVLLGTRHTSGQRRTSGQCGGGVTLSGVQWRFVEGWVEAAAPFGVVAQGSSETS